MTAIPATPYALAAERLCRAAEIAALALAALDYLTPQQNISMLLALAESDRAPEAREGER